jgi:hypothetical protein
MSAKSGSGKGGSKARGSSNERALSGISKSVKSANSLRHMGVAAQLLRDSLAMERTHVAWLREKMCLPPLPTAIPQPGDDDGKSFVYDENTDLMANGDQIVGLRIYQRGSPPRSLPIEEGTAWVAYNMNVIEQRATYRDSNRKIVTHGELIRTRSGDDAKRRTKKDRLGASPLRTIAVRLMPHEARAAGKALTSAQLDRAMDRTITALEEALGCEVVSAAVHRMKDSDLHIHIQYTMVQAVEPPKPNLKRDEREWRNAASATATASLEAEGHKVSSSSIGKRIKELVDEGKIPSKPTKPMEVPCGETIYKKRKGLRPLTNDTILGYSLKFKLNLVRGIQEAQKLIAGRAGQEEMVRSLQMLTNAVTSRNDGPDQNFRKKAARTDEKLEAEYMDVWLERQWRASVVELLPAAEREKLPAAAIGEARNYAMHGTTRVEQSHLDAHNKDVAARLASAEAKVQRTEEALVKFEKRIALVTERFEFLAQNAEANMTGAKALRAEVDGLKSGAVADRALAKQELTDARADRQEAATLVAKAQQEAAPIITAARDLEKSVVAREAKVKSIEKKAGLWDLAVNMIRRAFELMPEGTKTQIQNAADTDTNIPLAKVPTWTSVFSRLARMAGAIKGKAMTKSDGSPLF